MKKALVIVSLLIMSMLQLNLSAANMNVGANFWYAWYEPAFKDEFMGKNEIGSRNNSFEMNEPAAIVYAGLFSFQFSERWSLGGVFSYGKGWECKSDYIYNPSGIEIHMYKQMPEMERFEGDLTINYKLNNIFKIFFGWKSLYSRGSGTFYYTTTSNSVILGNGDFKIASSSNGPGAGVSSIFNLADNLYLITTLSAIYQKSEDSVKTSTGTDTTTPGSFSGANGTMNLAYVIPDSGVTLSLGGRYQYLKNWEKERVTKFYGVMLSAIYGFSI